MTEESAGGVAKKFLYVNRRAPYGSIYGLESLEVVLIGAAFEQDVSLAFLGDGVFQLTKGQDTKGLEVTNAESRRMRKMKRCTSCASMISAMRAASTTSTGTTRSASVSPRASSASFST